MIFEHCLSKGAILKSALNFILTILSKYNPNSTQLELCVMGLANNSHPLKGAPDN